MKTNYNYGDSLTKNVIGNEIFPKGLSVFNRVMNLPITIVAIMTLPFALIFDMCVSSFGSD